MIMSISVTFCFTSTLQISLFIYCFYTVRKCLMSVRFSSASSTTRSLRSVAGSAASSFSFLGRFDLRLSVFVLSDWRREERQPHPPAGTRTGAPAVTTDDNNVVKKSKIRGLKRSLTSKTLKGVGLGDLIAKSPSGGSKGLF